MRDNFVHALLGADHWRMKQQQRNCKLLQKTRDRMSVELHAARTRLTFVWDETK